MYEIAKKRWTHSFAKDLVLLIGASSSRIVVGPLCIFEEPLLRDRSRLADDIGKFRKHAAQLGSTGRVQLLGYMTLYGKASFQYFFLQWQIIFWSITFKRVAIYE